MARLTDGAGLGVLRGIAAGVLVVASIKARPVGMLSALRRPAGLLAGGRGRGSGVVARSMAVGSVWPAVKMRGTAANADVFPVEWRSGAALAMTGIAGGVPVAESLLIVPCVRGAAVSAWKKTSSPGKSAGESAYVLPAEWAAWPLPAGYIGEAAALLALARGEAWAVSEAGLLIGGRVLVDQYGVTAEMDAEYAGRWVGRQLSTVEKMLGVIWMASGPAKVAAMSDMRAATWGDVRKRAKSLGGVVDGQVRAALIADLDFLQVSV